MPCLSDPVQTIVDRIGARQIGDRWQGNCPAHDDKHASLSIARGEDGRALLKCHAGCRAEDIVAGIGMTMRDLFKPRKNGNGHTPRNGQHTSQSVCSATAQPPKTIVATYDYRNAVGELVYQAVRHEPKDFRQRQPSEWGGWVNNLDGVTRILYRLPELLNSAEDRPDDWVMVVEGEKDVDRLTDLDLVATCNPMGAGKWEDEYSETLRGRHVAIIPDNDDPGRRHVEKIASSLAGKAAEIRLVELPGIPEKGDTSDFLDAGGTAEQLAQLIAAAPAWQPSAMRESAGEPWPDPQPLPNGLPPVNPFDGDLLPASLRPYTLDVSERMQCPTDYAAVTAMIAAATLIGRKIAIRPKRHDDWQVVPNLYGMCVGRPSLMKTPAQQEMLRFLSRLEIEAKQQHAEATEAHEANRLIAAARKKAKGEELKKAVKDGGDVEAIAREMLKGDDQEPTRKRYIIHDVTIEKLGIVLAENPNGVLIHCDELASFLRSMDKQGHESDRGFYLTAWDGTQRFSYDRVQRGTVDIEGACVSILGSIQPGVIADYLRGAVDGGHSDDGLMQRFQMTVWPDAPEKWTNIDRYADTDAKALAFDAYRRLADLQPGDVEAERDNFERDALPFLRFAPDAQDIFDDWRADLEGRLRSEHPAIEAHLAKYRSLVPSLALICHLLDAGIGPVTAEATQRAVAWANYLESHARRLYASVTDSSAISAKTLAGRILAGDVADNFAAHDVYRRGLTGLDRGRTEEAIDMLLSLHWLEERVEPTAGRPKTRYAINPKIIRKQPAAEGK